MTNSSRSAALAAAAGILVASAHGAVADETLATLRPDAGFGEDGAVAEIGRGAARIDGAARVAFDAQGRIVVAGTQWLPRGGDDFYRNARLGVARFLPDGRPDRTFGPRGVRMLPLGGEVQGLAIDRRGRIVVCGTFRRTGAPRGLRAPTYQVLRLRANGGLDREFSGDGFLGLGRRGWIATAVRTSPADDSLRLVATRESDALLEEIGVVSISARGAVDRGFGDDGFAPVGASLVPAFEDPTGGGTVWDLAVDELGRTLAATEGGVKRLGVDGVRDDSFGAGGFAEGRVGVRILSAQAVALDAAGRIVVVGRDPASIGPLLYRTTADGAPDPSFGDLGAARLVHTVPGDARITWVTMDLDRASGTCVVAGQLDFLTAGFSRRVGGRFAAAVDLAAPAAAGIRSVEDADDTTRSSVGGVAVAPDGASFVVAGGTWDLGAATRPARPLVERVARGGAEPIARPNLRVVVEGTPTVVGPDEDGLYAIDATVRVDCTGTTGVAGAQIDVRLSADDAVSPDDRLLESRMIPAVAGGASRVIAVHRNPGMGTTLTPGALSGQRLIVVVDAERRILQTDETDDVAVSAAFE